ncbi:YceI family protein [Aquimarina sp. U1-2]|uniref:YceI family protein n=1 Tax=Aquimarina sp. U1-2 TaxID=2823141 RepID=UPI001AED011B|nr:YceI family protein [Aquimarina sp. U1-2]MBP2831816.1 YceI family protein [Aquimarina sp. U1-2]
MPYVWNIDKNHSNISFSVDYVGIGLIRGIIREFKGQLIQDEPDSFDKCQLAFEGCLDSIDTNYPLRDKFLKSRTFFNTNICPVFTFKGKRMEPIDDVHYIIPGNLSIKNHKQLVYLTTRYNGMAKGIDANHTIGFELTVQINRFDFGLDWNHHNEEGTPMFGKALHLHMALFLTKHSNAPTAHY